jgi:hypothetical protein
VLLLNLLHISACVQVAGGSLETGVASRLTLGRQEEQLDEQTRRFREQVSASCWLTC